MRKRPASREREFQTEYYVAMDGDDRWSGVLLEPNPEHNDGPFASVGRARRAVAEARAKGAAGPFRVWIRGGRYYLPEEVVAGIAQDAATSPPTVTYAAFLNEEPLSSAGLDVPGWRRRQEWYLTLYLPPLGG